MSKHRARKGRGVRARVSKLLRFAFALAPWIRRTFFMRAYSVDLRQKIVSAYESGHGTFDELADTFEVGRRTVARFVGLARAGESLWPKPHGGGRPARLGGDALTLLGERVAS